MHGSELRFSTVPLQQAALAWRHGGEQLLPVGGHVRGGGCLVVDVLLRLYASECATYHGKHSTCMNGWMQSSMEEGGGCPRLPHRHLDASAMLLHPGYCRW